MRFNAQSFENIEASQGKEAALAAARCWIKYADGIEFGIEHIDAGVRDSFTGPEVAYVNTGDTYSETIVRRENGTYALSCWGDELERLEAEHTEETDETRCWYCGEWTPKGETCHENPDA